MLIFVIPLGYETNIWQMLHRVELCDSIYDFHRDKNERSNIM